MFSRDRALGLRKVSDQHIAHSPYVSMVGDEFCFPDGLIDLLSKGFPTISFRRAALHDEGEPQAWAEAEAHHRLIIMDATYVADLADAARFLKMSGAERLVLAYQHQPPDQALLLHALQQDATPRLGLLPLNVQIDVLISMVRLLLHGQLVFPIEALHALSISNGQVTTSEGEQAVQLTPAALPAEDDHAGELTPREWEVLTLLAQGKQNKILAAELGLSEHTVKLHIHHLIRKLGVSNRTGAVVWYLGHVEAAQAAAARK
jgi:DNA-binding NarL/FixJ family response regulator